MHLISNHIYYSQLPENHSPKRVLTIFPNKSWILAHINATPEPDFIKKITKTTRNVGPFPSNNSSIMLYYGTDKKNEFNKMATNLVSSSLRKKIKVTGNITLLKYTNNDLTNITYEDFLDIYGTYNDPEFSKKHKLKLWLQKLKIVLLANS